MHSCHRRAKKEIKPPLPYQSQRIWKKSLEINLSNFQSSHFPCIIGIIVIIYVSLKDLTLYGTKVGGERCSLCLKINMFNHICPSLSACLAPYISLKKL